MIEYTNAFARNVVDVEPEKGKKRSTKVRFRAVAKAKVDGKWKQKSANLVCAKGTGKNAAEKTATNIQNALEKWRQSLNEVEATKAAEADAQPSMSVYDVVAEYVDRRAKLSEAVGWDSSKTLPNNEKVIQRSSVRDYHHTMSVLKPSFAQVAAEELTIQYVLAWEERMLLNGASISRVRKCHVLLKQSLNDAAIRGVVKANVMAPLKAPTLKSKENTALSQQDMQKVTAMLAECEPTAVVVGAMLALHCGLRGGEVCGLTWDAIDFGNRLVHVVQSVGIAEGGGFLKAPKSESGKRSVYMDDFVVDMLSRRRSEMLRQRDNITKGFGELFVTGYVDGGYLSPTTLSRQWTALSTSWGLKGTNGKRITLHSLRHSFVDAVRNSRGGEDKVVRDLVGHSTVAMTDRYGTKSQSEENEAVKAASAWMAPDVTTKTEADVIQLKNGTED